MIQSCARHVVEAITARDACLLQPPARCCCDSLSLSRSH
jgi:hypothetical protein